MKLLYLHQYFVTNEGSLGTRSYDVSRHLVNMGNEVTVVCGVHEQSGLPRCRSMLWDTHYIDGIKVIACNVYYSNKLSVPRRLWSFFYFAMLSVIACIMERDVDLIFATSTPLTVGIPARLTSSLKKVPYIFEVRDLWPEDLLAAGRLKKGFQYRIWEWLEAFSYGNAKKILLVSRGFHDRMLQRGFNPEKLATIVLGADGDLFLNAEPDSDYFHQLGLTGKTIAVYAGAQGDANGLMQLIDAAERLRERPDIAIVLIGDGKMRGVLQETISEKGLTNIFLLPPLPKQKLPSVLKACDIGLMILKQISRPRWVTPNKIFDYMFAGLPTIVNFSGTTADLVVSEGIGVAAEPGSAEDLAAKIIFWVEHSQERKTIGAHAQKIAWEKYDRKKIAESIFTVFKGVLLEENKKILNDSEL